MKTNRNARIAIAFTLVLAAACASAQQVIVQVVDVQPLSRQVARDNVVCQGDQVQNQEESVDPTRAIAGGAVGGLLGAQMGKGNGRKLAIAAGAIGGALMADRYGRQDQDQRGEDRQHGQRCQMARQMVSVPTGSARVVVDVDGVPYEWITRVQVQSGDLVPVDVRALRRAM